MAHLLGDEEQQIHADHQPGANMEENKNVTWFDRIGQFSNAILTVASSILIQLLSGYASIQELDNHLTVLWAWILFLVYLSAGGLMIFKCYISDKKKLSHRHKMISISLTLFTGTAVMVANAVILDIIHKSYRGLATIPVFGVILVTMFLYFEMKSGQNQGAPNASEDDESMVKNCFKLSVATTSAGFVVQTTIVILGYLKNPNFPKSHPQWNLTVPFTTSALGTFAMIITSSPLNFRNDLMYGFLKQISRVMLFSLCLVAAILSAEFLDCIKIVLAMTIPSLVETIVKLWQKSREEEVTGDTSISTDCVEVDSMFPTVAGFGFQVLSIIYAVKFGSEEYDTYLTYSVLFLLLAIVTSSIRMVFPFHPTCHKGKIKVIESIPVVQALVSLALLLAEICTYINGKNNTAVKSIPWLGPLSPLPH